MGSGIKEGDALRDRNEDLKAEKSAGSMRSWALPLDLARAESEVVTSERNFQRFAISGRKRRFAQVETKRPGTFSQGQVRGGIRQGAIKA